jgi:hypothetical protein
MNPDTWFSVREACAHVPSCWAGTTSGQVQLVAYESVALLGIRPGVNVESVNLCLLLFSVLHVSPRIDPPRSASGVYEAR